MDRAIDHCRRDEKPAATAFQPATDSWDALESYQHKTSSMKETVGANSPDRLALDAFNHTQH
jgi:hypothetical protein